MASTSWPTAASPGATPPSWPQPTSSTRRGGSGSCESANSMKSTIVSLAEARRIAVRAQVLDGTADGILDTVRRIGLLQLDPIATVAQPQQLVLWSRLGHYERAELDRLLWEERRLFEWGAFIWPIEDFPLVRARMRRRRGTYSWERRGAEVLKANARVRGDVLPGLGRRGPLRSRAP